MHLILVIPIANLPRQLAQTYTYLHSTGLPCGAIVKISLGTRTLPAVVLESAPLNATAKQNLKRASFHLKQLEAILKAQPLIDPATLELVFKTAEHFATSAPTLLKSLLPQPLLEEQSLSARPQKLSKKVLGAKLLLWGDQVPARLQTIIRHNLKIKNAQVLLLAPTIEQVNYWVTAFKDLALPPATVFKGSLSAKRKAAAYIGAASGKSRLMVGTRGAVFLPFYNLQTIIIADEPNPAHISRQRAPLYDARWVAQRKAQNTGATLVYMAPLPTLATWLSTQPSAEPHFSAKIEIVRAPFYIKKALQDLVLSPKIEVLVQDALTKSQKVLWYHNRRGLASATACRVCKHVPRCQLCRSPLALHQESKQFIFRCHNCGAEAPFQKVCTLCRRGNLIVLGFGVTALEALLNRRWPKIPALIIDSDAFPSPSQRGLALAQFIKQPGSGFIIGTAATLNQSIATPLAIVPNFDAQILFPAYTAHEDTLVTLGYLMQVSQHVLIQTTLETSGLIKDIVKGKFRHAYERELKVRAALGLPPTQEYFKLVLTSVRGNQDVAVKIRDLKKKLGNAQKYWHNKLPGSNMNIIGPYRAKTNSRLGELRWCLAISLKDFTAVARSAVLNAIPSVWLIEVNPRNLFS